MAGTGKEVRQTQLSSDRTKGSAQRLKSRIFCLVLRKTLLLREL